jgi:hypothetical protein
MITSEWQPKAALSRKPLLSETSTCNYCATLSWELKLEVRPMVSNYPNMLVTAIDRFGSHTVKSVFRWSQSYLENYYSIELVALLETELDTHGTASHASHSPPPKHPSAHASPLRL